MLGSNELMDFLRDSNKSRILTLPQRHRYSISGQILQMSHNSRLPITRTYQDRNDAKLAMQMPVQRLLDFVLIICIRKKIVGTEEKQKDISSTPSLVTFPRRIRTSKNELFMPLSKQSLLGQRIDVS